jgi:hypothetical protein
MPIGTFFAVASQHFLPPMPAAGWLEDEPGSESVRKTASSLSRWIPRYSAAATTVSSGTSRRRGAGEEPPESQERRAA